MAGTNDYLVLGADFGFHYAAEPADLSLSAISGRVLRQLEQALGSPGSAVLLTGMGRDGARALLALRQCRLAYGAQDEKTCIVYGMPRAAKEAGAAAEVLPLSEIAASSWSMPAETRVELFTRSSTSPANEKGRSTSPILITSWEPRRSHSRKALQPPARMQMVAWDRPQERSGSALPMICRIKK